MNRLMIFAVVVAVLSLGALAFAADKEFKPCGVAMGSSAEEIDRVVRREYTVNAGPVSRVAEDGANLILYSVKQKDDQDGVYRMSLVFTMEKGKLAKFGTRVNSTRGERKISDVINYTRKRLTALTAQYGQPDQEQFTFDSRQFATVEAALRANELGLFVQWNNNKTGFCYFLTISNDDEPAHYEGVIPISK